jgi:hypothetical protein
MEGSAQGTPHLKICDGFVLNTLQTLHAMEIFSHLHGYTDEVPVSSFSTSG